MVPSHSSEREMHDGTGDDIGDIEIEGSEGKRRQARRRSGDHEHMFVAEMSVSLSACATEEGRAGEASLQRRGGAKTLMPSGVHGCLIDVALIGCLIKGALKTVDKLSRR